MKNLILITILSIAFAFNAKATCKYAPKHLIKIHEESNITIAYTVRLMRLHLKHPQEVQFHAGVEANYETCTGDWIFSDVNTYYTRNDAQNNLKEWVEKGYIDAFILTKYIYSAKNSQEVKKENTQKTEEKKEILINPYKEKNKEKLEKLQKNLNAETENRNLEIIDSIVDYKNIQKSEENRIQYYEDDKDDNQESNQNDERDSITFLPTINRPYVRS
jgi:hypothetical protein